MGRDLLLLLEPGFADLARAGQRFICPPDGALIEGLLAGESARSARFDIRRLPFTIDLLARRLGFLKCIDGASRVARL